MVWVCISTIDTGNLVKNDGIMKAKKYHQIFTHHVIQSRKCLIGSNPKHTVNTVKMHLDRKTHSGTLIVKD